MGEIKLHKACFKENYRVLSQNCKFCKPYSLGVNSWRPKFFQYYEGFAQQVMLNCQPYYFFDIHD